MTYNDDDTSRGRIAPKKGIPKLRELIADRKAQNKEPGAWQPATSQRLDFRSFTAKLATPDERTPLQRRADARHDFKQEHLSELLTLDLLSVRVMARDRKHKGKVVECWLRGVLLRRIIERTKPTRAGIGHDRYTVAIALLVNQGIAEPDPSGANGYVWTDEYKRLPARAGWLIDFVRREGDVRRLAGHSRYQVYE
jgi:hypothetical protein